jgi:hypothetical protein
VEALTVSRSLVATVLFKRIHYLGEDQYLIRADSGPEKVDPGSASRARTLVLSKHFYFEANPTFPVASIKEIRAAVAMDPAAYTPLPAGKFFLRKTGQTNEGTRVNLWFPEDKIAGVLDELRPWFIIPETALFPFVEPGVARIYSIEKGNTGLVVFVGADGSVRSVSTKNGGSDLENFRRMMGAEARECPVREIKGLEEYCSLLAGVLQSVPLRSLLGFMSTDFSLLPTHIKYLRRGAVFACAMFLAYAAAMWFIPSHAQMRLTREGGELSQKASALLEKEALIESYFKKQKGLASRFNTYTYKLPLLDLLQEAVPEGTIVRQLAVSGNRVELRGTTRKASELLDALSRAKGVKGAQFNSPVRGGTMPGMEDFTLSFTYEQGG